MACVLGGTRRAFALRVSTPHSMDTAAAERCSVGQSEPRFDVTLCFRGFRAAAMATSLLLSSACLPIPHVHTKQPRVQFEVTRSDGANAPGAIVAVYSGIIIGEGTGMVATALTNSMGRASIARVREFHPVYGLLPDLEAPWVWAWCVSAPGHERQTGRWRYPPRKPVRIQLPISTASSTSECPTKPRSLSDVAPRER